MSSSIVKILIAALAAAGAVQALPQPNKPSISASAPSSISTPAPSAAPAKPVDNTALIQELELAPTAIDRFKKLFLGADGKILGADDLKKKVVFDFNGATPAKGAKGGSAAAANIKTFPVLTDLGISTTVAFLNPCGMNTPHIHPRATEFLTVVDGSIDFGFILENGLVDPAVSPNNEVASHLNKFEGTVFPMGSIHYQFNNDCKPATFVATLNSEDPGTSQVAQNFFGLNADIVKATLGFPESIDGKDIEQFRATIPANLALGIDKCLARCGISKN